jgi:hypothetical protein
LQEKIGTGVPAQLGRKGHGAAYRHDAAGDDAVNLAVGQGGFIWLKKTINQKVPTQAFGVEGFEMFAVNGLANVHEVPLGLRREWALG